MSTKITKYGQSCILLEKDGHALIIDLGSYAVEDNGMSAGHWPKPDAILLTHKHADHAHQPTIKALVDKYRCPVITNSSFAAELEASGIPATALAPYTAGRVGRWHIHATEQHHGRVPPEMTTGPEDIGFVIDRTFYTPGDSLPMTVMPQVPVLFVPVVGPEMSFDTARRMVETVKPVIIVPIHFSNVTKFPIDRGAVKSFAIPGVETRFLADGESFTWSQGVVQ